MEVAMAYTEWGKRVRAAAILAELSLDDLAHGVGMSSKSLSRTILGLREPREGETAAVKGLTGLPGSFFDLSLSPAAATASAEALVGEVLARVQALQQALAVEERILLELVRRSTQPEAA